jgi:hypothetical protein
MQRCRPGARNGEAGDTQHLRNEARNIMQRIQHVQNVLKTMKMELENLNFHFEKLTKLSKLKVE